MTGAMTHRPTNPGREMNLTRLAWLVSIAAPVALIGLLCLVKAASATAAQQPAPEPITANQLEEECFEWEEGGLECEEAEGVGPRAPEECLLRTARARVVSSPSRNRLLMIVRYSTVEPTHAYLDFQMRKGAESLDLGVVRRHLGNSGVLRLTETLGDVRMERARDASDYLLTLDVPTAPSYCQPFFTRLLSLRRTVHRQTVWFQSDPAVGPFE